MVNPGSLILSGVMMLEYMGWQEAADLVEQAMACLLYTSDAADERSSVDLGGRRIINKKKRESCVASCMS